MSTIEPTDLPAAIRSYMDAHERRDINPAIASFAVDAVVHDDGRTYRGTAEVLEFLRSAGSQFRYTATLERAERQGEARWTVLKHLEGDFPGGSTDLTYGFTMAADRIASLTIRA